MFDQTARTQAWLTDFTAMVAELDVRGYCGPRPACKRARKVKPRRGMSARKAGGPQRVLVDRREALLTATRQAELVLDPVRGEFDITHRREVHRRIFQDLRHHGPGEFRPKAPGHFKHRVLEDSRATVLMPYALRSETDRMLGPTPDALKGGAALRGFDLLEMSEAVAQIYARLDYLHPFREENSRTLRLPAIQRAGRSDVAEDRPVLDVDEPQGVVASTPLFLRAASAPPARPAGIGAPSGAGDLRLAPDALRMRHAVKSGPEGSHADPPPPLRALVIGTLCVASAAPAPARTAVREMLAMTAMQDGVELRHGALLMRIDALTDAVIRIRVGRDTTLPEDASWAVPAAARKQRVRVTPTAAGFRTAQIVVHVDPATLALTVTDLAGKVIVADAAPVSIDGPAFTLRKAMPQREHYFGLGDKTGGLDRRGKTFVHWNTDAFGFSSADDPTYKAIPFYIGVGGEGGSYGLFLDNTWRTAFDFGHRTDGVLEMTGPDGPIDYYLIAGPTTAEVVRRYSDLTGRAPLAPKWALGYQQSRYSYMTEAELRAVAARLRRDKVPTDVLWLDIGFLDKNTPFTVDKIAYPDLPGLIRDMGRDGFKVVTITDLHTAANRPAGTYPPYDSGKAGDHFVKNHDGSTYVAPVWPGPSAFPDFTQERTREWYGGLFDDQVAMGVAGAWNDMNEPAIFETPTKTMPIDTRHRIATDDFAPRTATHAEIHNVYGMENTRATFGGLRRLAPDARAFVMTRASYAGGQRYAVTWTGDNKATWDHLKLSIQQIINLGLSGFAYSGADVSGFAGGPSAELLTRWFQIGAFYPVFRNHSATDTPRVEPWVDGPEHLAIRRRFVEERYRLMPYFYALADQHARAGDPILRPVFYDDPDALRLPCDQSWTFTLGKSLLIAPPPSPESPQAYDVCLPAGGWFDYWSGLPVSAARVRGPGPIQSATQATGEERARGDRVREVPRLDHLPVFVRAGTILPRQALVQSTSETPAGPLLLDIYPGEACEGVLYADDGHSMAYARGVLLRQTIRCERTPTGLRIAFDEREGSYAPWWRALRIAVHGWDGAGSVKLGARRVAAEADAQTQTLTFDIADQPRAATLTIDRL